MAFTGTPTWPGVGVTTSFSGLYPGPTDYPSGTDYTGDVISPTSNLYPGVTTFAGQGNLPILDVYISFSNVSTSPPVWTWVNPATKVRQFSVSRTEGEAGTATLVLDNRNRDFDPTFVSSPYYPNVRPLNQVWLREQFSGQTNDMFKGYAESYEQQWPGGGWSDAITVVKASDEFKILALSTLPVTNPPRSGYADVVAFDSPQAYYPLEACQDLTAQSQEAGLSQVDWEEEFSGWKKTRAQIILAEQGKPKIKVRRAPVKKKKPVFHPQPRKR